MNPDTQTFLKVLDPEDTSTGGGSASAIAGAMAAALIAMTCRLSPDTPTKTNDESFSAIGSRAQTISDQLLAGSQEDSNAFQAVRQAYKLPKGSEEERKIRNEAVQAAWLAAARIPLENAARCVQVFQVGVGLVGRVNPRVRSDLNCAMMLAQAGALGCLENVAMNLPFIHDPSLVAQLAQRAGHLREQLAALTQPTRNDQTGHAFRA